MSSIHDYSDILGIPRPELKYHHRMPLADRAAQFSPFAALTGFFGMIEETGRTTEQKIMLDEREIERINHKLMSLLADIKNHPEVEITYFVPDKQKEGGNYRTITGSLQKIDNIGKMIIMTGGEKINFDDIIRIAEK